jgi:hypothetical protein
MAFCKSFFLEYSEEDLSDYADSSQFKEDVRAVRLRCVYVYICVCGFERLSGCSDYMCA